MQSFLTFVKSRQFFIQLGSILVVLFLVFFITVKWLSSYTNHNEFVEVPDFNDQLVVNLDQFVQNKDVSYLIVDSVYNPKEKPGVVIRQEPEPKSRVKHNRTVYLYVTGMVAPQIEMPKLVDRSARQARLIIETYGLKMGHISEKAADCNGCVVAQLIKGRTAEPGQSIKKGSVVDLVIGKKDYGHSSLDADTSAAKNEAPDSEK